MFAADPESGDRAVKVLIADDHAIFREGLKLILALEPDMNVVGETGNAQETLRAAHSLDWDVMILDYAMPGAQGMTVLRSVKTR